MSEPDDIDMTVLNNWQKRRTASAQGRREKETRIVPYQDRRRLRKTGRTEQMNLKVRPEFKQRLIALAHNMDLLLIEYIEIAVEEKAKRDGA